MSDGWGRYRRDGLSDRSRSLGIELVVAYLAALGGLGASFAGNFATGGTVATVGVALLGLSFLTLFHASLSLASLAD